MTTTTDPLRTAPVAFLSVLVDHWVLVTLTPLLTAGLVIGWTYMVDETFSASTTFMPEEESGSYVPDNLAAIAGTLGLNLRSGVSGEAPPFYAALARSPGLLRPLLYERFSTRDSANPRMLLDILRIEAPDSALRDERGLRALRAAVISTVNREANTITLEVRSGDPLLSATLANRIVEEINSFNLLQRQTRARAKSEFVTHRLEAGRRELREAEERVRAFLEANRSYASSPELSFERERLDRELRIKQEVFLTLSREAEVAAIEAVNDSPVITVVDAATPPATRLSPHRSRAAMIALLFGGALGVLLAMGSTYVHSLAESSETQMMSLRRSLAALRRDIRRVAGLRPST